MLYTFSIPFQTLYHINCNYLKFLLKVPTSGWFLNLFLQHFVFLVSCLCFHYVYHVFCCYCCCCCCCCCYLNLSLGGWGGTSSKEPTCQCRRHKRHGFSPWVGTIPWRREWSIFLPGEFYGQRSLEDCNPKSWTWLSVHAKMIWSQEYKVGSISGNQLIKFTTLAV